MALEDAVALSTLVELVLNKPTTDPNQDAKLEKTLNWFYELRSPRTSYLKEKAMAMRKIFATPPGSLQKSRDQSLKEDMMAIRSGKVDEAGRPNDERGHSFAENSANIFQDVAFRDEWFGYDARRAATDIAAKYV